MPLGILYLLFIGVTGRAAAPWVVVLLLFGGPLTAVPLALFSWGARRVAYSTVGLVQYIGPTLQLLLGVFLFRERFTLARAAGFSLIWAGLAVYAADGLYTSSRYSAAK